MFMMIPKSLRGDVFVLCLLLLLGSAGCASDFRKGPGSLVEYETKLTVGKSPMAHKWAASGEPDVLTSVPKDDPVGSPFPWQKPGREQPDQRHGATAPETTTPRRSVRD